MMLLIWSQRFLVQNEPCHHLLLYLAFQVYLQGINSVFWKVKMSHPPHLPTILNLPNKLMEQLKINHLILKLFHPKNLNYWERLPSRQSRSPRSSPFLANPFSPDLLILHLENCPKKYPNKCLLFSGTFVALIPIENRSKFFLGITMFLLFVSKKVNSVIIL